VNEKRNNKNSSLLAESRRLSKKQFVFLNKGPRAMDDVTAAILLHKTCCTPQEVQRLLRSSRSSTYKAIRNGTIPSFRLNKAIRVPTSWLRAVLTATAA
jgi:hypothetical protein